jgi:hypothetical protein
MMFYGLLHLLIPSNMEMFVDIFMNFSSTITITFDYATPQFNSIISRFSNGIEGIFYKVQEPSPSNFIFSKESNRPGFFLSIFNFPFSVKKDFTFQSIWRNFHTWFSQRTTDGGRKMNRDFRFSHVECHFDNIFMHERHVEFAQKKE